MPEGNTLAPPSRRVLKVVAVGFDGRPGRFLPLIKEHGFEPILVSCPESIPSHLPVLVYSPKQGGQAQEVLRWAQKRCLDCRVVVVTDHADFGHYYDVMSAGAYEYVDLSDETSLDRLRHAETDVAAKQDALTELGNRHLLATRTEELWAKTGDDATSRSAAARNAAMSSPPRGRSIRPAPRRRR